MITDSKKITLLILVVNKLYKHYYHFDSKRYKSMTEPIVQFLLRIPASVKQRIEDAAKENNRSINAEALVRLEKSFEETQSANTELAELNERLAIMEESYNLALSHYDRILKLFESQLDVKKLLVTKD